MKLSWIFLLLCLLITADQVNHAWLTMQAYDISDCCCETESDSKNDCSECPEKSTSNYCGCHDFSLTFIPPDVLEYSSFKLKKFYEYNLVKTYIDWSHKPITPPPKLV